MPNEQLDLLQEEIEKLKGIIEELKAREFEELSQKFDSVKWLVHGAFDRLKEIDNDFEDATKFYNNLKTNAVITQINNPAGNALGFNVFNEIFEAAKSTFLDRDDIEAGKKKSFGEILRKITSHPITRTIAAATPVTTVISNVITAASSFLETKIESEAPENNTKGEILRVVKGLSTNYHNVISDDAIEAFREKVGVYITLYESLSEVNTAHETKLQEWKNSFDSHGFGSYGLVYKKLLGYLKLPADTKYNDAWPLIDKKIFFDGKPRDSQMIRSVLDDESMKDAVKLINRLALDEKLANLLALKQKLFLLSDEFVSNTINKLKEYDAEVEDKRKRVKTEVYNKLEKHQNGIAANLKISSDHYNIA
jgi:hypothetical protein